jgi:hypothetical protein
MIRTCDESNGIRWPYGLPTEILSIVHIFGENDNKRKKKEEQTALISVAQSEIVEHGIVAPKARAELARIAHRNFSIRPPSRTVYSGPRVFSRGRRPVIWNFTTKKKYCMNLVQKLDRKSLGSTTGVLDFVALNQRNTFESFLLMMLL